MPGSQHQRNTALAKSHWLREARTALRQHIRDGTVDPWPLLKGGNPEWEPVVRGWRLDRMLQLIPGVGEGTVYAVLAEMGMPPSMTLLGMTFERRAEMSDLIQGALEGVLPAGGIHG